MDFQKAKQRIKYFMNPKSHTRIQLENWLNKIEVNTQKVLDVGSGMNPAKYRVKKWKVESLKTLDNNSEYDCHPDIRLDLNRLDNNRGFWTHKGSKSKAIEELFHFKPNIIFCLEVMEYIYKPETVLQFFHDILEKDGLIYISFHTLYPIHQPIKNDSLRYTKSGIVQLMKAAGFGKIILVPRTASSNGMKHLDDFIKAEKMHYARTSSMYDIGYLVEAGK